MKRKFRGQKCINSLMLHKNADNKCAVNGQDTRYKEKWGKKELLRDDLTVNILDFHIWRSIIMHINRK